MLFGTDGIRGVVNKFPILPDFALRLGMAVGIYLQHSKLRKENKYRLCREVIIAKDTRLSGYMLEPAITAGLIAVGVNVTLLGPMPTPALQMLTKSLRANLAVMITASHNSHQDNGFKLFDYNGLKVSNECQQTIQSLLFPQLDHTESCDPAYSEANLNEYLVDPNKLGHATRLSDTHGRYIEYVKASFPREYQLSGMKVVLDCANGASYKIAPTVFWELGIETAFIGCHPNGVNINQNCGSMHPAALQKRVIEEKADIGIAFDGDADRAVICDELGNIISGDFLIALIAKSLKDRESLNGGVVLTHASNGGLLRYLKSINLPVCIANVGDRHIAIEMQRLLWGLGGEPSGHVLLEKYNYVSDGIITCLQVLTAMRKYQQKASELFNLFQLVPQISRHIAIHTIDPLANQSAMKQIEKIKAANKNSKISLRKSGTERIIRLMVEDEDETKALHISDTILDILTRLST